MQIAGANPGVELVRPTACYNLVNDDAVVERRIDNLAVLNEALDEEAVVQGTFAEDTVTKFDISKVS